MKKLVLLVAMLSLLIAGNAFGAAFGPGIPGYPDPTVGTDFALPVLCEKAPVANGFNTNFAIFSWWDEDAPLPICTNMASVYLYDVRSRFIVDWEYCWTDLDVVVDDFCNIMNTIVPAGAKAGMEITKNGKTFYAGYIRGFGWWDFETFVGSVYWVDLNMGFADVFELYENEYGFALAFDHLAEGVYPLDVELLWPRWFIANADANTWQWWVFWAGKNLDTRLLSGYICNENEVCISRNIPIPDELNIINVADHISPVLGVAFPKAGYAFFVKTPFYEHIIEVRDVVTNDLISRTSWPGSLIAYEYTRAFVGGAALSWSGMKMMAQAWHECTDAAFGDYFLVQVDWCPVVFIP